MFYSARIRLTAWYLLIIMCISILFSVAFYRVSTVEIERLMQRIEFHQQFPELPFSDRMPKRLVVHSQSFEALESAKEKIKIILIMINGGIFLVAGGAGYFLAGRTLRPIQQMIDEQNQFISNSSHELRTPLATLRAEMEGSLLEKNISDKRARQLIKSNLEELSTLQELANNLLRITQIHSTQKDIKFEKISVALILNHAIKKMTPLLKQKNITFTTSIHDLKIKGDKSSLIELFVILLDNAIKYSPQKSTIEIKTQKKNEYVEVRFSDSGIGILQKDIPHIFERFYRADKSRSEADGYGLGLSIAKKIVTIHNGQITVESKKNRGTTFIVSFPLFTA